MCGVQTGSGFIEKAVLTKAILQGLVQRRPSNDFLAFRFLLHPSLSDRCTPELREKIFDSHWSVDLRFRAAERDVFHRTAGRRYLRVRPFLGRRAIQHGLNDPRRIAAQSPLRHRTIREFSYYYSHTKHKYIANIKIFDKIILPKLDTLIHMYLFNDCSVFNGSSCGWYQ